MTETQLNQWISSALHPAHVQRIETSTAAGVPDMNVCHEGHEFWIESKLYIPGRGVLLRKEQYAWGMRRATVGGRAFVVYYCDPGSICICMFPHIQVLKVGKYLVIDNLPLKWVPKSQKHLFLPILLELSQF